MAFKSTAVNQKKEIYIRQNKLHTYIHHTRSMPGLSNQMQW